MLKVDPSCRRITAATLALVLLAVAGGRAVADKPRRRGFLLQIADEKGLLPGNPEVTIRGNLGTTRKTQPKDDGQDPDVRAGDRLYVQPVPTFFDPKVIVEVRAGDKLWKAEATFKPEDVRARLVVILEPNGKTQANIQSDDAPPPPNSTAPPPPPPGERKKQAVFLSQDETSFGSKLGTGFVLWVVAFVLFGVALALIRISKKKARAEDLDDADDDEGLFDDDLDEEEEEEEEADEQQGQEEPASDKEQ